ncbi:hypothetical protein [Nonomuraea candida]|uniref:hypothetical protein n=1 Tax=Nonomuraea candida TaxID=359159 RepID=UPI000693C102|nr:hypothetical protein [Nonomuraea candida]
MDTLPKLAAAGAAVAIALVALAGAVIAGSGGGTQSRPVLRWSPGACVTGDYALTACNGGDSEVVAMASDPPGPGGCPVDTDVVLRVGEGRTACVRNFLEPHPGAPGGGGGLLRPGDCVTLDGRERACADSGWYGRALALVPDAGACPDGTLDVLDGAEQAICLGPGGQVLDRGSCVAEPATDVIARSAVTRVPCDSPHAWARVLSFESAPAACPRSAERYLRSDGGRRPVTCLYVLSK